MINDNNFLGQVLNGLVVNIFGSEFLTAIFVLVVFLAIGFIFKISFKISLIMISPILIFFMAEGWISGAVGFVVLFLIAIILAFHFLSGD